MQVITFVIHDKYGQGNQNKQNGEQGKVFSSIQALKIRLYPLSLQLAYFFMTVILRLLRSNIINIILINCYLFFF
jgi:hypothetical protein